jgi:hypothetical protein
MKHLQTNGHNNTDKDKKMERKFNKMEKKTQLKKSGPAKPVYKAGAKENLIQDITNRFRVTAREARDIVTAVSTAVSSRNVGGGGNKFAVKDIKTQIKEVGTAALTGKKGTTAAQSGYGGLKKGTTGAGNLDRNVSKTKRN